MVGKILDGLRERIRIEEVMEVRKNGFFKEKYRNVFQIFKECFLL